MRGLIILSVRPYLVARAVNSMSALTPCFAYLETPNLEGLLTDHRKDRLLSRKRWTPEIFRCLYTTPDVASRSQPLEGLE